MAITKTKVGPIVALLVGLCVALQEIHPKDAVKEYVGCPYAAGLCPSECGQKVDVNGCRKCLCGVPYFRWPWRQCPPTKRPCPEGCSGYSVDENGCRKCSCGTNPFFRSPFFAAPPKKLFLSKYVGSTPTATTVTTAAEPEPAEFKLDVRISDNSVHQSANLTGGRLPEDRHVF